VIGGFHGTGTYSKRVVDIVSGLRTLPVRTESSVSMQASEVQIGEQNIFEFSDGSDIAVVCLIEVPDQIVLTTTKPILRFNSVVTATGSGNADAYMQLEMRYIRDAQLFTKTADETITQAESIVNTLNQRKVMNFSLDETLMQKGDYMIGILARLGTDSGNDTYTGKIGVPKVSSFIFAV